MWKRTKNNLKNSQKENKGHEFSGAATKAMFDHMAAVCMTMGMTYGVYVYIPIASTMYGYPNNM